MLSICFALSNWIEPLENIYIFVRVGLTDFGILNNIPLVLNTVSDSPIFQLFMQTYAAKYRNANLFYKKCEIKINISYSIAFRLKNKFILYKSLEIPTPHIIFAVSSTIKLIDMKEYAIAHIVYGELTISKYTGMTPLEAISLWQCDFAYSAETIISITRIN